jgi:hypothetical protein
VLASVDATLIEPPEPGQAFSLARVTDPTRDQIVDLAVSDDYVFFAASWDGVYRIPKYGGTLSAVEVEADANVIALAANHDRVFWSHNTFGQNDRVSQSIRTRAAAGGPIGQLPQGAVLGGSTNFTHVMRADDEHVYMIAESTAGASLDSVVQLSISGGEPLVVPVLDDPSQQLFPSWVPDYPFLYLTRCASGTPSCTNVRRSLLDGSEEKLAEETGAVVAVDEDFVYLRGEEKLQRLSKADKTLTTVAEIGNLPNGFVEADATHLYFLSFGSDTGAQLLSVPKAGGTPTLVSADPRLNRGVWRMAQDEQYLFVLVGPTFNAQQGEVGTEILAFPKVPQLAPREPRAD